MTHCAPWKKGGKEEQKGGRKREMEQGRKEEGREEGRQNGGGRKEGKKERRERFLKCTRGRDRVCRVRAQRLGSQDEQACLIQGEITHSEWLQKIGQGNFQEVLNMLRFNLGSVVC